MFKSTKFYGHEQGLSCCFRQWRANHSHCHWLHGYALAFKFTFSSEKLDERGWVVDFGGLKALLAELKHVFDHRLIIAEDDPQKDTICSLMGLDIANVLVLPKVGIESFAKVAFDMAKNQLDRYMEDHPEVGKIWVESCECFEHPGNSAIYSNEVKSVKSDGSPYC